MAQQISKTLYIEYLECPKNAWLKLYKPQMEQFIPSECQKYFAEEGNRVEALARELFRGSDPVLFQLTSSTDVFCARSDVLEFHNATDSWCLYEIKSSSQGREESRKKSDYIEDVTFQVIVLKDEGKYKLNKVFLITISQKYTKIDDVENNIDVQGLFSIEDITEQVKYREQETRSRMVQAKIDLLKKNEKNLTCPCIDKRQSKHCATFRYSNPYVPEDSIYNIAYINPNKLKRLVADDILAIKDIPELFDLSDKQKRQVSAHKQQKPEIDHEAIRAELSTLQYPLYFLDYETHAPAIPIFKGTHPYQHIPFQFSLHVVEHPDSDPIHKEYLHTLLSNPSLPILQKLVELIGSKGNIVVWNKVFENSVNINLAKQYPAYQNFLENINERLYDLMSIFRKQMYIDPNFKGRISLKDVLPVFMSELSYNSLEIQDGITARRKWIGMIHGNQSITEKKNIAVALREYCCLDTRGMYEIWRHLLSLKE